MKYPTYLLAHLYYAVNLGVRHLGYLLKEDGRKYLKTLVSSV